MTLDKVNNRLFIGHHGNSRYDVYQLDDAGLPARRNADYGIGRSLIPHTEMTKNMTRHVERNRNHPGALHYLIHVYDTQTFARMGLRQARLYAEIAPASSHALHMPSHIFRHLGMWDEVAASNEDSYEASVEWQERTGRALHMRDFHAMDWLLDAYLRLGRFEDAKGLMDELDSAK